MTKKEIKHALEKNKNLIDLLKNLLYSQGQVSNNIINSSYYRYIPTKNEINTIIAAILSLKDISKCQTIVDIGSGDGLFIKGISQIVSNIINKTIQPYGIEVQKLSNFYINTDIRDAFDINQFNDDIIYMYNPIQNNQLMIKLIDHVIKYTGEGSTIIFNCASALVAFHLKNNNFTEFEKIEGEYGKIFVRTIE